MFSRKRMDVMDGYLAAMHDEIGVLRREQNEKARLAEERAKIAENDNRATKRELEAVREYACSVKEELDALKKAIEEGEIGGKRTVSQLTTEEKENEKMTSEKILDEWLNGKEKDDE